MESDNVSELLTAGEFEIKMRKRDSYEINNSFIPHSPLAISPGGVEAILNDSMTCTVRRIHL
jgi:hypothetical protein